MALTPQEETEGDRIASRYNGRPVNPTTNPGGIGRGGDANFFAALKDFAGFGKGVVRVATEALASISTMALRFENAVAAIQAGPVSSVNGQSGAVTIDLATISAEVEDQLDEVKAAQASLVAAQAGLLDDVIAYSLTFRN